MDDPLFACMVAHGYDPDVAKNSGCASRDGPSQLAWKESQQHCSKQRMTVVVNMERVVKEKEKND